MDNTATELDHLRAENERLRQLNRVYREAITFTGQQWRNQISLLNLAATKLDKDDSPTDSQQQAVQRIQHSAGAILSVARYYLHLPHIENRQICPKRVFVGPAEDIFKPLLFSYADLLAARRQTTTLTTSRPNLLIWADRELLITACQLLLHLAIEWGATDSTIALHMLERGHVDELCIWNRGTPIAEQKLSLFNTPFDPNLTSGYDSPEQVSLYLAQLLIESHAGMLSVEATPTIGIKFVFTLPKR